MISRLRDCGGSCFLSAPPLDSSLLFSLGPSLMFPFLSPKPLNEPKGGNTPVFSRFLGQNIELTEAKR